MVLFVSSDQVLNSGTTEEVLLLESQLFSLHLVVIRIEDASYVLCSLSLRYRPIVVSFVEGIKVELIAGFSLPKS